jgi:hypothetical protein
MKENTSKVRIAPILRFSYCFKSFSYCKIEGVVVYCKLLHTRPLTFNGGEYLRKKEPNGIF